MGIWKNPWKGSQLVSVFQALSLMLLFGTFLITLLTDIVANKKAAPVNNFSEFRDDLIVV